MILAKLGKLAAAKSYTTGTDQASLADVIEISGDASKVGLDNAQIDIECYAAAVGAGAITIDMILADNAALSTNARSILRVYIAAITDPRVATAGEKILQCSVPRQVAQLMTTTKKYLGFSVTVAGTSVGLNIAITPGQGHSQYAAQVVKSNVGIPS